MPSYDPDQLPARQLDILARYWQDALARISALALSPGAASSAWTQAKFSIVIGQINQELTRLKRVSAAWTGDAITRSIRHGQQAAQQQLDALRWPAALRQNVVQPGFRVLDPGTLEVLARDTYQDLARAADSTGRQIQRTLRRVAAEGLTNGQVNEIIARGVIDGNPSQTARELQGGLEAIHGKRLTLIDKNGDPLSIETRYYAKMVAQNRTREASVLSRHERLRASGIDLVIIIGRISKNFCTHYLDHVYSLSGTDPDYPPYSSLPGTGPPFHPNCSKSSAPFVKALASRARLEQGLSDPNDPMLQTSDRSALQRTYQDLQLRQQATARGDRVVADIRARAAAAGYTPPPWSPSTRGQS